jgi:ketosteroid isomerase-like protein
MSSTPGHGVDERTLQMMREGYRALGFGASKAVLRLFDQRALGDTAGWIVHELTSMARHSPREVVADDLFRSIPPQWQVIRVEPMRFEPGNGCVIVMGHVRLRLRGTWEVMSVPFAHVWTLAHGRVVRVLSCLDDVEIERIDRAAA